MPHMRGTSDVGEAFGVKVGQDEHPLEDAGMSRRKLFIAISNACHCLIIVCISLNLGSVFLVSIVDNYWCVPSEARYDTGEEGAGIVELLLQRCHSSSRAADAFSTALLHAFLLLALLP